MQIQMKQTHEGTTIGFKAALKTGSQQEKVEDGKGTGNALSGQKQDFQNPEGQTEDSKESNSSKMRIAQLWAEMTNLKKGMLIGGVVFALILIVVFTLLIVALSYKPKVVISQQATLPMPTTNEKLQTYEVQGTKQNLLTPDKKTTFQMTTITEKQKARMLQDGSGEDASAAAVVLEFDYPKEGVTILATSPDDIIVHADYDRMISSYSDKRLLFQTEMMAALRTLQEDFSAAPADNALAFDDPTTIIKDAENSLLRAVSTATSTDPAELAVEYSETVTILQQADGTFVPETQVKSSRLLRALNSLRGLQQWNTVFDEINAAVLVPKIKDAQENVDQFIANSDASIDDAEVSNVLRNSNFASNVDIDISYEEPEAAASRLLQGDASANGENPPTAPPASDSKPEDNSASAKKPTNQNKPSNRRNRKTRPVNPRARRNRAKGSRSKCISEESFNATEKCTGRGKRKTCDIKLVNNQSSPYKLKDNKSGNSTLTLTATKGRYTCKVKTRRITPKQKPQNKVKPQPVKPASDSKNNLSTEPAKDNVTPVAPTQQPAAPAPTTTPTSPAPSSVLSPAESKYLAPIATNP